MTRPISAATALVLLALAGSAHSTDYNWVGPTTTNEYWNVGANWDPSGFPNSFGDTATISHGANRTIFLGQDIAINSLVMNSVGYAITLGQTGETLSFGGTDPFLGWYRSSSRVRAHTIACNLNLDSSLTIGGNTGGSLTTERAQTITGTIAGTGKLTVTLSAQDAQQENEYFHISGTAANTYGGGTSLQGNSSGVRDIFRANKNSAFGSGDVALNAHADLELTDRGATDDMIDDAAALLQGQSGSNYGRVMLRANVNETVALLSQGGAWQAAGTYGSTLSSAANKDDTWFVSQSAPPFGPTAATDYTGILTVLFSGPAVLTTTPPGTIPAGDSITVTNIAGAGCDQGKVAAKGLTQGIQGTFSLPGIAAGDLIPPENGQIGATVTFDDTGLLNGAAATGGATLSFAGNGAANVMVLNGSSTDRSVAYTLSGTAAGNTGSGTAEIVPGGSYAGLYGVDAPGGGTAPAFDMRVDFLGGTNTSGAEETLSLAYLATHPGAATALGDVAEITGVDSTLFVVQMGYDPALLSGSESDLRLGWWNNGDWLNAVEGNHGANDMLFVGDGPWNNDLVLGHHGVDTLNNVAWAVLDYDGQFAPFNSGTMFVPEPGAATLAAVALCLLPWLVFRRRR